MSYRIGIGYDIHRLVSGRKLFIGGVEVPYPKGLLGHSDADVLLHAICDALLGAAQEGDIGRHFPDTDSKYKGISSIELLKKVDKLINKKGFSVNNLDAVVIAEEPKLSGFIEEIQNRIAKSLKIKQNKVSIKAKTNESIGEIGRKEAIACYAIASIIGKED